VTEDGAEIALAGGVGNGGRVVRVADTVRRPPTAASPVARAITLHLESVGFDRCQRFRGVDDEGRDVYSFVAGEVPLPPFAAWTHTDEALAEVASVLRDFHAAMESFPAEPASAWCLDLADTNGAAETICHNDVCPENVVFADARVAALIDFDLAAPGRRVWDVARTARMWAPVSAPGTRSEWPAALDAMHRLDVFLRAYGLTHGQAAHFPDTLQQAIAQGQAWVRRKVESGEPAFVEMWHRLGLSTRYDADEVWLSENRLAIGAVAARSVVTRAAGSE
jgi:hypothetical protein